MNTTPRKFYAADIPASGQPAKKLTPMAAHIEWMKERHDYLLDIGSKYLASELEEAIFNATSLLEAEREMVEEAFTDGDMNRTYVDPADYFTQNYQQ